MESFEGHNTKLENSEEKGMLNGKEIIAFVNKAMEAVCEINLSKGFGSGFFCKIPYTENNNLLMPVLVTNNHVLSSELISSNNDIKITINGKNKTIPLKQRKIWTDEKMDFTCIEIKEKEDNIDTFFNLDDNILKNNLSNEYYLNQNVLIFAINKENKQIVFSNGLIKRCKDCFFDYTCNTYEGCSGGCIVNQSNNSVIGIHRGGIETKNKNAVNEGIFISIVIKYIKKSQGNLLSNQIGFLIGLKKTLEILGGVKEIIGRFRFFVKEIIDEIIRFLLLLLLNPTEIIDNIGWELGRFLGGILGLPLIPGWGLVEILLLEGLGLGLGGLI